MKIFRIYFYKNLNMFFFPYKIKMLLFIKNKVQIIELTCITFLHNYMSDVKNITFYFDYIYNDIKSPHRRFGFI